MVAAAGVAACEAVPVRWDGDAVATSAPLVEPTQDRDAAASPPPDTRRCAGSLRTAATARGRRVAVWWSAREGRPGRPVVHLLAAWQDTTAHPAMAWEPALAIDTLDQGPADAQAVERGDFGCARPAPSVVVDSLNGFVHVTYALRGPEGTGIFYAHQMDPRAAFEPPIAILYGERLGASQVASDGDIVGVAYEDPNRRTGSSIGLAVSITAGHLFDQRLFASDDSRIAEAPQLEVRGRTLTVGWSDLARPGAPPTYRVRRAHVEP